MKTETGSPEVPQPKQAYHIYQYNAQTDTLGVSIVPCSSLKDAIRKKPMLDPLVNGAAIGNYQQLPEVVKVGPQLASRAVLNHLFLREAALTHEQLSPQLFLKITQLISHVDSRDELRRRLGMKDLNEIEPLLSYLEMVRLNFPHGVPGDMLKELAFLIEEVVGSGMRPFDPALQRPLDNDSYHRLGTIYRQAITTALPHRRPQISGSAMRAYRYFYGITP